LDRLHATLADRSQVGAAINDPAILKERSRDFGNAAFSLVVQTVATTIELQAVVTVWTLTQTLLKLSLQQLLGA